MHYGHAQYLPIAPSLFALLAVALGILLILVQIRVLRYAYMQLGVSSGAAFLLLFGSLLGSYVNIPIAALGPESMVTEREVTLAIRQRRDWSFMPTVELCRAGPVWRVVVTLASAIAYTAASVPFGIV